MEDWKLVIFSDELKFNSFGSDGHWWCWRKPGEEFNKRYVRKEVKHGGGNMMVWGCVTAMEWATSPRPMAKWMACFDKLSQ